MRISDWSSDVCSSDLVGLGTACHGQHTRIVGIQYGGAVLRQAGDDLRLFFGDRSDRVEGLQMVGADSRDHADARSDRGKGAVETPWLLSSHLDDAEAVVRSRRSEEHTSELQSLMRHSYAVFCL